MPYMKQYSVKPFAGHLEMEDKVYMKDIISYEFIIGFP